MYSVPLEKIKFFLFCFFLQFCINFFPHFQMFCVCVCVCVWTVDRLSELLLGSAPFLTNYTHMDTESRE